MQQTKMNNADTLDMTFQGKLLIEHEISNFDSEKHICLKSHMGWSVIFDIEITRHKKFVTTVWDLARYERLSHSIAKHSPQ